MDVIEGQGTMGCEIYNQIPDIDTVVVNVGGGGILSALFLLSFFKCFISFYYLISFSVTCHIRNDCWNSTLFERSKPEYPSSGCSVC